MPRSRSRDSPHRSGPSSRPLPGGAEPISESDYFLKSAEFRVWLKEEKHKYFDELSGDKARRYFHKFVKEWNRGKLNKSLYAGVDPSKQPATSQTAYKWGFASKRTKAENDALQVTRAEVGAATYDIGNAGGPSTTSGDDRSRSKRVQGPTLPSRADHTLAREAAEEQAAAERAYQRKRDKAEARERIEDMVGPREVGRERMLEKKQDRRESDRAFRERGDEGLEMDEGTLMGGGGGDSFKAQWVFPCIIAHIPALICSSTQMHNLFDRIARRDAARAKRDAAREDRGSGSQERAAAMRERDKATMDMFMQMAKQKYG